MGRRVTSDAATHSAGAAPDALSEASVPPLAAEGRFELRHDKAKPLDWTLRLGEFTLLLPRGLPTRQDESRAALASLPIEAEPWDAGSYLATPSEGSLVVMLDGARVRGRFALSAQGEGAWTLQRLDPANIRPMPDRVLPMLASPGEYPRDELSYAFEVKWDGIRALAYSDASRFWLRSRNLGDITLQYPELRELGEKLRGRQAILDGEITAFDEFGMPSFQRLQARMGVSSRGLAAKRAGEVPVIYMAFDLLYLDGEDRTGLPYEERRALLEGLDIGGAHAQVSPAFVGDGRGLLVTPGLEGLVAKRLGSTYEPGARSAAWIKVKSTKRQEVVIGGYAIGRGARRGRIGALLVGVYRDGKLSYAGGVGTGFSDAGLDELRALLDPHRIPESPFAERVDKKGDLVFVEPRFVCEVEFTEWTREGRLRHPSFKGLRSDKDARDVVQEPE